MSDSEVVFHAPVRPGDVISTSQVLRSLSEPKTTKLGTGRFWVIDVPYRNQDDELVGVETFTGFGYRRGDAVAVDGGGCARGPQRRRRRLGRTAGRRGPRRRRASRGRGG